MTDKSAEELAATAMALFKLTGDTPCPHCGCHPGDHTTSDQGIYCCFGCHPHEEQWSIFNSVCFRTSPAVIR